MQDSVQEQNFSDVPPPSAQVIGSPVAETDMPVRKGRAIRYFGSDYIERHEKRTYDRLDYLVDLSRWLESTETIVGVSGITDPGDLAIDAITYSPTRVRIWLSSGADGSRYFVKMRVTTLSCLLLLPILPLSVVLPHLLPSFASHSTLHFPTLH